MSDFKVNMRDVRFNFFEFLDFQALTQTPRFGEVDKELCEDVLEAAYDQARNILHPLNESGDKEGVRLENGRVKTPAGWREGYQTFVASGWNGLPIPAEDGGMGMPMVAHVATQEFFLAANLSFLFTPGLTLGAMNLIRAFGDDAQKATYMEKMITGEWAGTMCLTEPGAGSAVPDLKTTATAIEGRPGFYHLKGQKIFISSGDHDMTDNIVHLALGRVAGDPDDHRGVSLFIVPRLREGADGWTVFNDVTTVGIEEKLGIHASPTCSLSFGDNGDCEAWLVGGQGNGLRCMFQLMNEARLLVGVQGSGLAALAYERALSYARERVQGTRLESIRDADAERVAIIEHPDVRRMLMHTKALAEGARALCFYAAYCLDMETACEDEKVAESWAYQSEILTPIVKAWCSDEGFKAAEVAIQIHGGYGYIREYGVEQILRDAKIASIYEGTNGIQALDLLGRKIARRGGAMMMAMLSEVNGFIDGPAKEGAFAAEVQALGVARDAVAKSAFGFAKSNMKGDVGYPALHATGFLQMFGDLLVGWLLLRHAILASEGYSVRIEALGLPNEAAYEGDDAEATFLRGKISTARFFIHQIMPRVHARKASIDSGDRSALDMIF